MIKLKEIIKSGGGNAKINRFINRYVLSKKEKNEIINEIKNIKGNGSSSGSYIKYIPRYFSVDWSKCSEGWLKIFESNNNQYFFLQPFATVKCVKDEMVIINAYGVSSDNVLLVKAFSYIPCCFKGDFIIHNGIFTFEQCIEAINIILSTQNMPILTLEGITEITEEEYYKID